MKDKIRVVLPKKFDLVVGDTFQLFYVGVVEAPNPYVYDILAVCEKGRNYPRYFEYTPEEEGEHLLTVSVFDAGKNLLGKGETLLNVVKGKSPEKETNILCIGDSLTAGGHWVSEVNRRLTSNDGAPEGNGFKNFNFIGTCKKDNVGFEGYGGWKWEDFTREESTTNPSIWVTCKTNKTVEDQHSLWEDDNGNLWQIETIDIGRLKFNRFKGHTAPRPESGKLTHFKNAINKETIEIINTYNEDPNPFYDEESKKVSFIEYCKKHNFRGIDGVYVLLGGNGLIGNTKPYNVFCEDLKEKAKKLIDFIHADYPEAQIKIMMMPVPSKNGGTGASYGAELPYCDDYGLAHYVMETNMAYEKIALQKEYCEFVEFINISAQFDTDNNYPSTEKNVNTRSAKKEVIGTNGLHPTIDGYMQIADAVYRNAVKSFCK